MAEEYFGEDCPIGMVQVESVYVTNNHIEIRPEPDHRHGDGWKPTRYAEIELYVDGERYLIQAGDVASKNSDEVNRGLRITCPEGVVPWGMMKPNRPISTVAILGKPQRKPDL